MRRAIRLRLTSGETRQLRAWSRGDRSSPVRRSQRARIVLLAAAGRTNVDIARRLGIDPETAGLWRRRFAALRLEGIRLDAPRAGHRGEDLPHVETRILEATRAGPDPEGRPWTSRSLARALHVNHMTVYRTWRSYGLRPGPPRGKASDPHRPGPRIEGVFLRPPERAAILRLSSTDSSPIPRSPALRAPPPPAGRGELAALLDRWGQRRPSSPNRGPATDLLVFLRSIDARSDPSSRFLLVWEGFPAPQEGRIDRWVRSHPRFAAVPLPQGHDWGAWLAGYRGTVAKRSAEGRLPDPLAESLSRFLARNPPVTAPFVWSPNVGPERGLPN